MCSQFCTAPKCHIDYYGVLKLKRDCNDLDIKKAFRRLAIHYHPVRASKDENILDTFALIAEAYDVLSDPLKRAIYDQFGEVGLKRGIPGPNGHIPPYVFHGDPMQTYEEFFGSPSPYADLLDILEDPELMKSICKGQGILKKDDDVVIPLELSLNEIFHGTLKKMKIERTVFADPEKTFTKMEEKIFTISIDSGIQSETKIIFSEEGDQKPNTIPADIIFITKDKPHGTFCRENNDLLMCVDVSLKEALTGTVIKIDTLDFRTLRIPITSIITPKYQKVLENEGMPLYKDPGIRGNLVINFNIIFPTYLPAEIKTDLKTALDEKKLTNLPKDYDCDEFKIIY